VALEARQEVALVAHPNPPQHVDPLVHLVAPNHWALDPLVEQAVEHSMTGPVDHEPRAPAGFETWLYTDQAEQ
jgi:hypothetical protein